jgi:hypothetical protein
VEVKGKDSTGLEATFAGQAIFTRAVPGHVIRSRGDVKKIYMHGDLNIPSVGRFKVQRNYLP